jgi:hypothetical protein
MMKLKMKLNNHFSILTGEALLLLSLSASAGVFQGKIEGFRLASCFSQHCFRLISPVAYVSALDGNYAFDSASFTVQNRTLASEDVYYDRRLKKVFVRNVEGRDYIYDVTSGKLTRFGE